MLPLSFMQRTKLGNCPKALQIKKAPAQLTCPGAIKSFKLSDLHSLLSNYRS